MVIQDPFINGYLERIVEKYKLEDEFKNAQDSKEKAINKAFEIFSIATIIDKPFDEVYKDIIIHGYADGGIDGVYIIEQDGSYIAEIFQCKNVKNLKQNILEKFDSDFEKAFINGQIKPNAQELQSKVEECKEIARHGAYLEYRVNYIFSGDKNTDGNREQYKNFIENKNIEHKIYDLSDLKVKIEQSIKWTTKRKKDLHYNFIVENSNLTPNPEEGFKQSLITFTVYDIKALNFRYSAKNLCELYEKEIEINGNEEKLFSENIRGFLGFNKTNKKIRETLENPEDSIYFPFLNNGITVLCEEAKIPATPQVGVYNVAVKNPVIVNGLQTTKVIYSVYKEKPELLKGVYINIKLYEATEQKLIDKITEATNTQSPINLKDKISNKDFNNYAKEYFKLKNVAYLTKRGEIFTSEFSKKLEETISSEKAIKIWYSTYYEKPEIAKSAISKVLEEVFDATNEENNYLSNLFSGKRVSQIYEELYNAYLIIKVVDESRLKKKEEDKIDFLEHADTLICYGIYREIRDKQEVFNKENIIDKYDCVIENIKKIIEEEKLILTAAKKTYSHNNYFKKAKSRIDYNRIAKKIETDFEIGQI